MRPGRALVPCARADTHTHRHTETWDVGMHSPETSLPRELPNWQRRGCHRRWWGAGNPRASPAGECAPLTQHGFVSLLPALRICVTEAWIEKPSFGKPLEEHLAVSGREIAFPIEACVTMLLECGMQEEVSWEPPSWAASFQTHILSGFSPL